MPTPARACLNPDNMDTILTCYDSDEEEAMAIMSWVPPVEESLRVADGRENLACISNHDDPVQEDEILPGTAVITAADGPREICEPELEFHEKQTEQCALLAAAPSVTDASCMHAAGLDVRQNTCRH